MCSRVSNLSFRSAICTPHIFFILFVCFNAESEVIFTLPQGSGLCFATFGYMSTCEVCSFLTLTCSACEPWIKVDDPLVPSSPQSLQFFRDFWALLSTSDNFLQHFLQWMCVLHAGVRLRAKEKDTQQSQEVLAKLCSKFSCVLELFGGVGLKGHFVKR